MLELPAAWCGPLTSSPEYGPSISLVFLLPTSRTSSPVTAAAHSCIAVLHSTLQGLGVQYLAIQNIPFCKDVASSTLRIKLGRAGSCRFVAGYRSLSRSSRCGIIAWMDMGTRSRGRACSPFIECCIALCLLHLFSCLDSLLVTQCF